MAERQELSTELASHDLHHIWLRGMDLTADIMGTLTFSDVVFLLIAGRVPDAKDRRLLDAVLVSLMEHGLTLSALAARTTYWAAPEALQGAVAAGLLGAGSVVLGAMEECGRILSRVDTDVRAGKPREDAVRAVVSEYRAAKKRLPGIGHAIHTEGDPRAARLLEIAAECGRKGPYVESVLLLERLAGASAGKRLPLNVTGTIAAVLLELGIPWQLHRGFALISRTAGLVAHIGEEIERPITPALRQMMFEKK